MRESRRTQFTMIAFAGDFVLWSLGMTFIGPTTVMPTFIRQFTDSTFLIGLAAMIQTGGFLIPQLLVSNLIAHHTHKKPIMLLAGLFYRPLLWLFALFLVVSGTLPSGAVLLVFYVMYALFNVGDSVSTVPWFDILGKSVPPSRRGRVMGSAQILVGLMAIGAGQLVRFILSEQGPGFPYNYALCFAIAGTGAVLSWVSEWFIHEVIQPVAQTRMALREYLPALTRVLRHDRHFLRVTNVRLLAGMANMALPFYIIFGTDVLKFAPETVGLFITAQVIGGVVAGTLLGFLSERSGSKAVIMASLSVQMIGPLVALFTFWSGLSHTPYASWLYALVFIAVGVAQSSNILGFINYVLELAPPQERVTYIGLTNTLSGVLLLAPLVGATLIERISYTGMFFVVLTVLVVSLMLAVQMVEPRKQSAHESSASRGAPAPADSV